MEAPVSPAKTVITSPMGCVNHATSRCHIASTAPITPLASPASTDTLSYKASARSAVRALTLTAPSAMNTTAFLAKKASISREGRALSVVLL